MKTNEEMIGTDRMAIKAKNGIKIAIERKMVDDVEQYLIKTSDGITIKGMSVPNGILLVLNKMIVQDKDIFLDSIVMGNVGLRTVYVNQNGYLHEFIGSYPIEPEEDTYSGEILLSISDVEEISVDLNMFNDMMRDGLIVGTPVELGEYGLYYPQIRKYKPDEEENIDKPVIPIEPKEDTLKQTNNILDRIKKKIIRTKKGK